MAATGQHRSTRWLVALVSIFLTMVLLEAGARVYIAKDVRSFRKHARGDANRRCARMFVHDPVRGWRLSPSCTETVVEGSGDYEVAVSSNNHGFRDDKDYRFEKRGGIVRILVLGDSLSFGNGVEERQRYSNLLDDMLGGDVEVFNIAISNYGLDQAFLTLREVGVKYAPDLIVLGMSEPMFVRLSRSVTASRWSKPFFTIEDGALKLTPQPNDRFLVAPSLLDGVYLWKLLEPGLSVLLGIDDEGGEREAGLALTEKILERIVTLSNDLGAPLLVFTANANWVVGKKSETRAQLAALLAALSDKHEFHFLNLHPAFEATDYPALFYPNDGHYNARGHAFVAEQLCRFIEDRVVLSPTELICDSHR